ncbi:Cupredoxin [Pleomassaria siparia CBS 279.74]|uniref:Cupredoxin n=1 Tax=Pleomassaria siparia CBS 279.74 TaxID=1314801 RepID=A0A6G1KPM6_9PLEO|nr:Cupredoxin [Pleomassaria siparia CBS 279.74]
MRFSTIFAASAIAGSAMAADHVVVVGKSGLEFSPNNVTAAKGDTVTFKFWPQSHSVAQGAFGTPCAPLAKGFWSGYVPTTDTTAAASTTFMYTVQNASAPVWFYCTRASHCQGGMVGVINGPYVSTSGNTLEKYIAASKQASNNTAPTSKASDNPGFGMLMVNSSMSSTTNSTSAASTAQVNGGLALAGLSAMAYMLL